MYISFIIGILLMIHRVEETQGILGPPEIQTVEPNLGVQDTIQEITVHGFYFQNTTSILIGNKECILPDNAALVNPVISPCWLQLSREDACEYETTKISTLSSGDLIPCDRTLSCLYWISTGTPCPSDTSDICYTHRCLYGNHNQCYGFLNTPDYSWCDDGKACVNGNCVDARGESCESTVTCTLDTTNDFAPGLYDVSITSRNTTFVLPNSFRVMPQPRNVAWGTSGLPEYISPGHFIYAEITAFTDFLDYNHTIGFLVDETLFDNYDYFPELDIGYENMAEKSIYITVVFTDYSNVSVTSNLFVPFTYVKQPIIYSLCPSAILAFIDNDIIVQGDAFVNTSMLVCYINGDPVPTTYFSDHIASCNVVSNGTTDFLSLQISNDGVVLAPDPGIVAITGACEQLKPNSVAVGSQCLCAIGYEDTGTSCSPCIDGSYQPQIGQQSCIPCDSTEDTSGTVGNTSPDSCTCRDGRFREHPDDTGCVLCKEGMICEDGQITMREGYWRSSNSSFVIIECPGGGGSCKGGASGDSICRDGYEGPMCNVCADGYGRIGLTCVKCNGTGLDVFVMIILLIVAVGVLYALIISTTRYGEDSSDFGTTIKISVSYLQVLYYIGRLSADWSRISEQFFTLSIATTMSPSFLSVQCAMPMPFYDRIALTMILPLVVTVVIGVVHGIWYVKNVFVHNRVSSENATFDREIPATIVIFRSFIMSTLIVLYMIHPSISLDVLGSLRCEDVPGTGTSYMRDDMRIDCGSNSYRVYRAIAIIYTIFYIFGFIVLVGWRMYIHRALMQRATLLYNDESPARTYILFVRGYKPKFYLWEGMVLFRKIGVVICSAFLSTGLQLVWPLIILSISLGATVYYKPYERVFANRLDIYALIALSATIILGFHSAFAGTHSDYIIFAFLLLFNGVIVIFVLFTIFSQFQGPFKKFASRIADIFGINDKDPLEEVEMQGRGDPLQPPGKGANKVARTSERNIQDLYKIDNDMQTRTNKLHRSSSFVSDNFAFESVQF